MTDTLTRDQVRSEIDGIFSSFVKGASDNSRDAARLANQRGLTQAEAERRFHEALRITFEELLPLVKPEATADVAAMLDMAFEELGFTEDQVPGRYSRTSPQYKTLRLGAYRSVLDSLGMRVMD